MVYTRFYQLCQIDIGSIIFPLQTYQAKNGNLKGHQMQCTLQLALIHKKINL